MNLTNMSTSVLHELLKTREEALRESEKEYRKDLTKWREVDAEIQTRLSNAHYYR